jgi:hypothetical protein
LISVDEDERLSAEAAAQRVLADRNQFELDAVAAEVPDIMNSRQARDRPGLHGLTSRPSSFIHP